jgi:hypothetical protein
MVHSGVGESMTDQLCGIEIAKAFDHPLTTFAVCVAKRMPEGPATILLLVVLVFCAAAVPFVFRYYAGLVGQGAALEGSPERQDYDKLRASLAGGNLAARLYVKWLTTFLDWIERFFGDAGMADRTLLPRAFGLKKAAPLWTAPALDRCLLLALVYPIATIFVIWAISGRFFWSSRSRPSQASCWRKSCHQYNLARELFAAQAEEYAQLQAQMFHRIIVCELFHPNIL